MSKTFSTEDQLPDLKVPSLDLTLEKYLYSVRAVASDEEFQKTSDLCKRFAANEGLALQQKLKEREKIHRNWIEDIWLEQGYLELRIPLPYLNFFGVSSYHEQLWPFQHGTQTKRAALDLYLCLKFWKMLRSEEVEPHKNSKGESFSMHQLRMAFNTCRIPKPKKDEVANHFKTESEGETPTHAVVLRKGHLFKIPLVDSAGISFSPTQFEKTLNDIMEICNSLGDAPGVAALTSLDRDTWADVRDHMIGISQSNRRNMLDIESSVLVLSLDDSNPENFGEMLYDAIAGDPVQRWRDKSYNAVWTSNGAYEASADHTVLDGMVLVMYNQFTTMSLQLCNGMWSGKSETDELCKFEQLQFDMDDKVMKAISEGKQVARKLSNDLSVICPVFDKVGKIEMKQNKIYPDAFVQICLQLAYMRMHGVPAPTYETATTRQYYHGRTETCRTCTPELVKFCRALIDGEPRTDVQNHLKSAYERLVWLMKECQNNRGCDRHLFGLALAAGENEKPLPEIFTDPMYNKTGGNANFVLSTSFVGFLNSSGGALPMVDDGYGVFYRINEHRIVVTITTWKHSTVTDAEKFQSYLNDAIDDVYDLFRSLNNNNAQL